MTNKTIESFLGNIPKKKHLKIIHGVEWEYVDVLGPMEFAIALHYLENPHITDKDVAKAFTNFKGGYNKKFAKKTLEYDIQKAALSGLRKMTKKKISKHEFSLVIDYILWSISNREWVPDERAYLNWVCNFFRLFEKEEKERYGKFYEILGQAFDIPKEMIDIIKYPPKRNRKRKK